MAVITISRQFGAGGKTLGEIVSNKLGYTFLDNEIIQMISRKAKVSTDWVESTEKEAGGKLLKLITNLVPKVLVDRILDEQRGYIDEKIYIDLLHKIIKQIYDEGNTVILGRGGQYILSGQKDAFHVLLVADKNQRIRFMQTHYDLTIAEAINIVEREDKRRINLYRKFGREDYDQSHLYHLVLNMSRLTMEKASDLVCRLIELKTKSENQDTDHVPQNR
jgi:cytidylate kinase